MPSASAEIVFGGESPLLFNIAPCIASALLSRAVIKRDGNWRFA